MITDIATFSRASQATYWDAGRVLRTAPNNQWRLDHDPATGEALGYLAESARTNLLLSSGNIAASPWNTVYGIVANAAVAPDGTQSMSKIVRVAGGGLGQNGITQVYSKAAQAVQVAYSVFVRAGEFNRVMLYMDGVTSGAASSCTATFDLLTGAVVSSRAGTSSFTNLVVGSVHLGGGLYRCWISATTDAHSSLTVRIYAQHSATNTGDGASGIFAWGAQLEAGEFPTSYIPTTTAGATRAADVMSMPVGDWLNHSEGTMIFDGSLGPQVNVGDFDFAWHIGGGGQQTSHGKRLGAVIADRIWPGGSQRIQTGPIAPPRRWRIAIAWGGGSLRSSANGAAVVQGLNPGMIGTEGSNLLAIGHLAGVRQWSQQIRSLNYLPRAASNAELPDLSRIAA